MAVISQSAVRLWTKAEYLAHLRAKRQELDGNSPGRARALRMAISYLAVATPARTRWVLQSEFDAETGRPGTFWAESRLALASIIQQLKTVGADR